MLRLFGCCSCWFLACGFLSLLAASPVQGAEPELIDVFTAGEEGYHTYRIPAIITAPGGDLLAICEGRKTGRGDHGDLDLVLKRSSDGGRTWGPLQLVYEEGGDKAVTIGNPCPVVDQSTGVIWLPFNRDNREVLVTSSSDQGKTWTKPRDITADVKAADWDWYACGPGNAIQLAGGKHAGRLVIPCDHRVRGKGSWNAAGRSHVFYSDDHGKTWQRGGATDYAMNECAVVELSDGQLLLNMRSYRGKNCRAVAHSTDGGDTWGPATDDVSLPEPVCQGSLVRYSGPNDPGGSVLLFSNPASKGRDRLTVRLSSDEGKTWDHSRLLYAGSSAYSCLVPLPQGEFGVLLERDNYQKITFARCTLDWLAP